MQLLHGGKQNATISALRRDGAFRNFPAHLSGCLHVGLLSMRNVMSFAISAPDAKPRYVTSDMTDATMHGAMLVRRRFHRRQILYIVGLYIVGENNAGNHAPVAHNANGTTDQVPDLLRCRYHVHEFMRDILEQRNQIGFLLIITIQGHAVLLTCNRNHWLMIHLGVVQAIEQVDRAGT